MKLGITYFFNGEILTMDPATPTAHHMLVVGGRVASCSDSGHPLGLDFRAAGFRNSRESLKDDVEFVDLEGRTVIPGLTDSHVHFLWWGLTLADANLVAAKSETDAVEMLRKHVAENPVSKGQWIEGFGWTANDWPAGKMPNRSSLDAAFPDNPILLSSKCGHVSWANSAALAAAQINASTANPPGGEIERDGSANGSATGILKETASSLVKDRIPAPGEAAWRRAFDRAQSLAHSMGITGMHTPEDLDTWDFLQRMHAEDALTMRINFWIPVAALDSLAELRIRHGLGDNRLRISAVKLFSDGSLGGRTALMHEPYESEPENKGIAVAEPQEILEATLKANKTGLPMAIHAIGDRAVSNVLDAFEHAANVTGVAGVPTASGAVARNRIEHLQCFAPRDLERLRKLKPIASMQPIHLCADMGPADRFWGARSRWAYAFRTLADAGIPLAFGSDAPVEPINPFFGMWAATTRRPLELAGNSAVRKNGWYPEELISLDDTLKAYTLGPAAASGQSHELGSLSHGKLADFAVLEKNPTTASPEELRDMKVFATYSEGRCVYSRGSKN